MSTQHEKAERFTTLHERAGAFVVPNPWDVGSARVLEGLGFEALATTSAGFAQTLGRRDGKVSLDEKLAHCRALCDAVDIPVTVDLENGFGHAPADVQAAIAAVASTGAVGCSIEDFDGNGIYEFDRALERVQAAVEAARALDIPFTLTARAENLLHGIDDLDDTLRRLQAYAEAGADVLYAPGLKTLEQVREVCRSVSRPVNVLAPLVAQASVDSLSAAGARRLSTGGALALASLAPVIEAGREMLEQGTFGWLSAVGKGAQARKYLI